MTPLPEVVEELRDLFRDGVTPSRLLRHIAERHDGEPGLHHLIQLYFMEAFGVPIVRGVDPIDRHDHNHRRYWFLNHQLLTEMIQHKAAWDTDGTGAWLDGLTATDPAAWLASAPTDPPPPALKGCWDSLTPAERQYIQMTHASAGHLWEEVNILSHLCERLQQQVNELSTAAAVR